jgi:hypothetical protein
MCSYAPANTQLQKPEGKSGFKYIVASREPSNKLSLVEMQQPEKYKENFDVSSEGPSSEVLTKLNKFYNTPDEGPSLEMLEFAFNIVFFSGSCMNPYERKLVIVGTANTDTYSSGTLIVP